MTMIIPIRASADSDTEKVEWVMLELNGELLKPLDEPRLTPQGNLLPDGTVNDIRRRVELGSVKFDADVSAIIVEKYHTINTGTIYADGAPTLIIGNHELKGSAITLKEPFAVLRKRKAKHISQNNNASVISESTSKSRCKVQLEVVGVVKKKLMFDQYPKSIMTRSIFHP
ncbi:hypothetical protein ACHAW5_007731 [Stephanodiscus triporus]|uniref:DNA-directed RNA polymerase n=1 Tax=Stephanodiscus triporus TaxID=2934178 RepID=A0ABD3PR64_9STRA